MTSKYNELTAEAYINTYGLKAKQAAKSLTSCSAEAINLTLQTIASLLIEKTPLLLEHNAKDVQNALAKGLPLPMIERLKLTTESIETMAKGIHTLIDLRSPIGDTIKAWRQPNGLDIAQVRVPIGVIGIIFESRPNVTIDAGTLCLKSKNAAILRGGSEAFHSNMALIDIIQEGLSLNHLPPEAIQYIDNPDREYAVALMAAKDSIDVLIPRGGAGLIKTVVEHAKVPVIETGVGNCHLFVEATAPYEMALAIIKNAKLSRPSVCNAAETLILDETRPPDEMVKLITALQHEGIVFHGCEASCIRFKNVLPASHDDFANEYLNNHMALKCVSHIDQAIEHISLYGTKHSEAILTNRYDLAEYFMENVDAAAVYVNASTRFTDGSEFGFGAEIGISTQKLHARGPMGLEALTTTKYKIKGNGQIR